MFSPKSEEILREEKEVFHLFFFRCRLFPLRVPNDKDTVCALLKVSLADFLSAKVLAVISSSQFADKLNCLEQI